MDDAKEIVAELLAKLAELDSKVANYQQDMNAQFGKFSASLLKDVPDHVSDAVSRVIAESMSNYPMLNAASGRRPETPAALSGCGVASPRKPSPPVLSPVSVSAAHGAHGAQGGHHDPDLRSPHEREKEFRGVFTPSYLPLLDGRDQSPNPAPAPASPSAPAPSPSSLPAALPSAIPPPAAPPPATPATLLPAAPLLASTPAIAPAAADALPPTAEEGPAAQGSGPGRARPSPLRRQTDGAFSSADSLGSDGKARRSALRRSSSSTKSSPRRVRFDFQGVEVLPTASPEATFSPLSSLGEDGVLASEPRDEPQAYAGPSLLDIEGEEDFLPRPKKVSSTQALRALSRSSADDGSAWTVVNPDKEEQPAPDWPGEDLGSPAPPARDRETAAAPAGSGASEPRSNPSTMAGWDRESSPDSLASPSQSKTEVEDGGGSEDEDSDRDGSEDEFLSLRPKAPKVDSPPVSSPLGRSPALTSVHPPASLQPATPSRLAPRLVDSKAREQTSMAGESPVSGMDGQDDIFDFDGDDVTSGANGGSRKADKYVAEPHEGDTDDKTHLRLSYPKRSLPSSLPTMSICKAAAPATQPATPSSSRAMEGSVGSYKGQPLRMSAIVSPKVYEEAAALGDFNTFVGSVDGRSGFDAADMGSFRASFTRGGAPWTPRSFTERMFLEDEASDDEAAHE